MAFPTTGILEDFAGVLAAPPNANWTRIGGFTADLKRTGAGTCKNNSASLAGGDYWSAAAFGAAQEVFCTVVTLPTTTNKRQTLYLMTQNPGSTTLRNGYLMEWTWITGAGNDTWTIQRVDNNVKTQLATLTGSDLVAGEKIGFSIDATGLLTVWQTVSGAWTSILTFTDATYTGTGNIGFSTVDFSAGALVVDDFGGGTTVSSGVTGVGAIPSGEAFGQNDLVKRIIGPLGIPSAEVFGTATVNWVRPLGIPSAEAFGQSDLVKRIIGPLGIPSAEAFGRPTVGSTFITGVGAISSAEAFGQNDIVRRVVARSGAIPSSESFGQNDRVTRTIGAAGIVSGEAFGQNDKALRKIGATGISTSESFGRATINWTRPQGIVSAEAFGTATITFVVPPSAAGSLGRVAIRDYPLMDAQTGAVLRGDVQATDFPLGDASITAVLRGDVLVSDFLIDESKILDIPGG